MSKNPFVFQEPVTEPEKAYLRDARVLDSIVNGLLLGNYYTLIGPRYSGTTTMAMDILRTAHQKEKYCTCLHVDLAKLAPCLTTESLFRGIAQVGQETLADPRLHWPEVTDCSRFRDVLITAVRGKPARLIIAFDNLDSESIPFETVKVLTRCARVLFNQRLENMECHKISVLISGSQNPYELSTGSGSPFNIAELYWLHDLNPNEIEQLIRIGQQLSGMVFDDSAIAKIAAATEGDKYFVQRICHQCLEEAQNIGLTAVTQQTVSEVIEFLENLDYRKDRCFTSLVRALSTNPELTEIVVGLLDGKTMMANEYQADANRIQLTGVLKVENGEYRFRHEIYSRFLFCRKEMVEHSWKIHKDKIEQTRKLISLHDVALGIASALDPDTALQRATELVLRATESDTVAVYLLDSADRFHLAGIASIGELHLTSKILKGDEHARRAIAENRPIPLENPDFGKDCDLGLQVHSCIWLPLQVSNDRLGAMVITFNQHHDFSDKNEISTFEIISSHLATAVARTHLLKDLEAEKETLNRLYQVATKLRVSLNLKEVLDTITVSLRDMLNLTTCTIGLLDKGEERLDFLAHIGLQGPTMRYVKDLPLQFWHQVRIGGQPINLEDVNQFPELVKVLERKDLKSFIVLPLKAEDRFLGILTMGSTGQLNLDKTQWELITALTDQAAVAIEKAWLHQKVDEERRALDMTLKVLSHQLRAEPGFVSNTLTTLLADKLGRLNSQQRDRLEKAQRRLEEYHAFVDNINMYGRLKGGKLAPKPSDIQLTQMIRKSVVSRRDRAKRHGLKLITHMEELPTIVADKGMIEIAFTNILDNAIKFTPAGGRVLVEAWSDDRNVHIAVDDTGDGIPEEERDKVFEEYYQGKSTPTHTERGAGLGLYIAKRLVEMHLGCIKILKKDGRGTRIEIILPQGVASS